MMDLDAHLGGKRPFGLNYWPLAEDDPGVEIPRESIRLVSPDGALVRGVLWTPPNGRPWKTAVILSHPRGDFSVHYACPLLAAAGYAVLGFGTRYMGNDTDCLHENCIVDVQTVHDEMRRRGAEAVVLLGNSGGGSLMAMAQAQLGIGDGWIGMAAHPGEGVFMLQVIDPSVADETDPFSTVPELDMYHPDNGWRPWPEPCEYDPAWVERYRAAQVARVARIDAIAKASIAEAADARRPPARRRQGGRPGRLARAAPARGVHEVPHHLPHAGRPRVPRSVDRPRRAADGVAVRLPRSVRRELRPRRSGPHDDHSRLAQHVVGSESHAKLADTMPQVTVPTILVHPTADTEIRVWQAKEIVANAGAADTTYVEMKGAPHYLEGHRPEALAIVADWLAKRFP